jgi:hypothetical protein
MTIALCVLLGMVRTPGSFFSPPPPPPCKSWRIIALFLHVRAGTLGIMAFNPELAPAFATAYYQAFDADRSQSVQ